MSEEVKKLLEKLLALPPHERVELANSLLESLDQDSQAAAHDDAWDEEIARRLGDVDSGRVTPVSWDEARERLATAATKR